MTDGLRNFAAQYNYAINGPELIRRYRMIEDGKRDVATKITVAEKKAVREAKTEMARNMKAEGAAPDFYIQRDRTACCRCERALSLMHVR